MEHSAGLWWLTGRVTLFEAGVLTAVAAVARAVPVAARSGARRRGRWRQRRDDLLPPEVDCGHSIIDHFASYCTARRFCRRSQPCYTKYLSRADYYGGSQLPWPLQITTHHTIRLADYYTSTLQITSMERATRTHTLHTIGLGADTSAGTLSPAVAPGPDCWTHSTQLTGQLTRWRYVVGGSQGLTRERKVQHRDGDTELTN